MNDSIPHSRPLLGNEEAEAARRVILSGMLAEGPEVAAFERELAAWLGWGRAAAVAHGTAALHLALLGVGAAPGRSVILPSYCCVSVLNSVHYTGATPILVDCLPDQPDVDFELVRRALREDTVAVVVPHLFGRVVRVKELPVAIVEDATQSLGGQGVGRVGVATVYSFYATKMLAGGEGGAVVSRKMALDRLVRERRSYDGKPDWEQRYNYKLTDLAAALLRVQLTRLDGFLKRRAELAAFYRAELAGLDLVLPSEQSVWYRFVIEVKRGSYESAEKALHELGVGARPPVFRPIHHYLGLPARDFPHSQRRWRRSLSVPLYPSLTQPEAERVVACLKQVFRRIS